MRILIAGAAGAIGRPLVRRLRANQHAVFALTRSADSARALNEIGAEAVVADALDVDSFSPRAGIGASAAPFTPVPFCVFQFRERIDSRGQALKGGSIREDKWNGLASLDGEFTGRFKIFTAKFYRATQNKTLGTGYGIDWPSSSRLTHGTVAP